MKKYLLVLSILVLTLTTACGESKTELDKFKSYLKRKENYKCSQNICKEERKAGKLIKFTNEINFDTNTLTYSSNGNDGLNTSKIIYNWAEGTATYYSYMLGIKINASHNYNTDEFVCSSNYEDNDEDIKGYIDTECDLAKLSMRDIKAEFSGYVTESGTSYFNN